MSIGERVSFNALAWHDGGPLAVPVVGTVEGVDETEHGLRYRVRHEDGTMTVVDEAAVWPQEAEPVESMAGAFWRRPWWLVEAGMRRIARDCHKA